MSMPLLLILALHLTTIWAVCPDLWIPYHGSCYHLFSDLEQWSQAELLCTMHNAHLVVIETAVENHFIQNMVKNTHDSHYVWLGANDLLDEGVFTWIGSNAPMTFTDWSTGQPDNAYSNENCLEMWPNKNMKWNDRPCTTKSRFICEMRDSEVVG